MQFCYMYVLISKDRSVNQKLDGELPRSMQNLIG